MPVRQVQQKPISAFLINVQGGDMGFFRTTIKDIDKFRAERNIRKLVHSLKSDSPEVTGAALSALEDFGESSICEDMVKMLLSSSSQDIDSRLSTLARKYPARTLQNIGKVLSDEIIRLRITKTDEELICAEKWPPLLESAKNFMLQFNEECIPLLKELLSDKHLSLQIYVSEILSSFNNVETRTIWEYLLETKKIVRKRAYFEHSGLRQCMNLGEIPLVMGAIEAPSLIFGKITSYIFGLTDEFLYIVPYIMMPASRGASYVLPISEIANIRLETQIQKKLGGLIETSQTVLEIRSSLYCIDPYNLDGSKVTILKFVLGYGSDSSGINSEERWRKLIELHEILKESKPTKSEIFQTYFNKKNISL